MSGSLDHRNEKAGDFFGGVRCFPGDPPCYRFGETAYQMVQQIVGWNAYREIVHVSAKQVTQVFLEVPHKQRAAVAAQNTLEFASVRFQVIKVLRPEAKGMVERLHRMNTDIVLLTGDNKKTADYFAQQVGIKQVRAQLLPEEKVGSITAIRKEGKGVCMIGDGVNDAPALKTANVGVAMGGLGSDIAVDAADIVLMSDDISKLPYLKCLSNATVKTIKFSIGLSMGINLLAVTLSVMDVLNPTTGALVHNAGSCFVVLIAALLYDRKFA